MGSPVLPTTLITNITLIEVANVHLPDQFYLAGSLSAGRLTATSRLRLDETIKRVKFLFSHAQNAIDAPIYPQQRPASGQALW